MTVEVQIAREFAVRTRTGERLPTDDLHAEGEKLMEALLDLEQCNDNMSSPATASDATRGVVVAEMTVTAATEWQAVDLSSTLARTAIHTIGGATPGWDGPEHSATAFEPRNLNLEYV